MSWETKTHIFEKRFKPFQKTIIEACAKVVGLLSGGKVTRSDYFLPHVSSLRTLMRILELTIWSTTAKLALLNSEKTLQLPGHTNLLKRRCELKFSNPSRSVPFKILKDSPRRLTFFITQLFLIIQWKLENWPVFRSKFPKKAAKFWVFCRVAKFPLQKSKVSKFSNIGMVFTFLMNFIHFLLVLSRFLSKLSNFR